MTGSVVLMIIVGLILIVVSFFLSEKLSQKEESNGKNLMMVEDDFEFSEHELRIIRRKIEDVIAKQAKEILYETNDSLAAMANEKTIALGDYAVAVCEEIERNHKEVMFLYSMLDDKQKEVMNTVKTVNATNEEVKIMAAEVKQMSICHTENMAVVSKPKLSAIEQLSMLSQKKKEDAIREKQELVEEILKQDEEKAMDLLVTESASHIVTEDVKEEIAEENEDIESDELIDVPEDELDDVFAQIEEEDEELEEEFDEEFKDSENSNDIILEMHRNGNSIIDIAKQLGLGVGEVKLVIDLYRGE